MFTLIPDWEQPKSLTLVYPIGLKANHTRTPRESLIPFYENFLKKLNEHCSGLTVNIILQEGIDFNPEPYPNLNFNYYNILCQDVWIKDWAPLNIRESIHSEEASLLKTVYAPDYHFSRITIDNQAGRMLQLFLNDSLKSLKLNWDLGNMSTNGDVLIVTEKIYKENPKINKEEVIRILTRTFNVKKVIVLPVEKNDVVGHADSIARFITKNKIVVSTYPSDYIEENEYANTISNILERELNDCEIIHLPSELSEVINKEGIYSAAGNYINFFRLGNKIFVPQYGILEDEEVIDILKNILPKDIQIIPLKEGVNELAYLGGILSCVTWVQF